MQKLEDKIIQIGYRIGNLEKQLITHTKRKEEVEQDLFQLQGFELLARVIIILLINRHLVLDK